MRHDDDIPFLLCILRQPSYPTLLEWYAEYLEGRGDPDARAVRLLVHAERLLESNFLGLAETHRHFRSRTTPDQLAALLTARAFPYSLRTLEQCRETHVLFPDHSAVSLRALGCLYPDLMVLPQYSMDPSPLLDAVDPEPPRWRLLRREPQAPSLCTGDETSSDVRAAAIGTALHILSGRGCPFTGAAQCAGDAFVAVYHRRGAPVIVAGFGGNDGRPRAMCERTR